MDPEEAPDCWTYVSDWEAAGLLVILLSILHILVSTHFVSQVAPSHHFPLTD